MRRTNVLLGIALHFALGCKPQTDSETQSLDNLARANGDALNVNDCAPETPVDAAKFAAWTKAGLITGTPAARETLRQALGGIESVVSLYFSANYKIELRADAAEACAAAAKAEQGVGAFDASESDADTKIPGCWSRRFFRGSLPITHQEAASASANDEVSEQFVVILGEKPEQVRHAALRTLAFAVFQRLSRLSVEQGSYVVGQKSERFLQLEARFAELMLKDQAGDPNSMASVRKYLPAGISTWKDGEIAERWGAYRERQPENAARFQEFVAAEAFDSYYHCAKTKSDMKKNFTALHAAFERDLAPELSGIFPAARPVQGASLGLTGEAADAEPSFGLCGGGLFPNLGCGQVAGARQERFGAVFPRMSWAWGNPSGCGLFIRWNC